MSAGKSGRRASPGRSAARRGEPGPVLHRRDVVQRLLAERGDLLVIAGLGGPAWDVTAAGDSPLDFPMWGAMGGASMMGLGLALGQPTRRVLVITGDGEMLMALGALATIAAQRPRNLTLVVLDNRRYGETGMQRTHTAYGVDLAGMAKAAGFAQVRRVRTRSGVARLARLVRRGAGPVFAVVMVRADRPPLVLPSKDGVWLKQRFRAALGVAGAYARNQSGRHD
jgi:thiamine pyrophosphate-dependent acetolactate synthase large subunit-like protein